MIKKKLTTLSLILICIVLILGIRIVKADTTTEVGNLKIHFKTESTSVDMKGIEIRCIKIKLTCFFIFSFIFLIAFWYYLSSFCAVFPNTQIHLLKDTIISFLLSLLYQFGINLIPGLFRMNSLNSPNKDKFILYKISMIIQLI